MAFASMSLGCRVWLRCAFLLEAGAVCFGSLNEGELKTFQTHDLLPELSGELHPLNLPNQENCLKFW